MEFKEMDQDLRRRLIAAERDELTPLVQAMDIPHCPKCSCVMQAVPPERWEGILPKLDYRCPDCGTVEKASGLVVTR